jgi:hypothetical protein
VVFNSIQQPVQYLYFFNEKAEERLLHPLKDRKRRRGKKKKERKW